MRHAISGFLLLCAALQPQVGRAANTTYYVDSTGGNDANNGTTEQTAWKTLAKVEATALGPGDSALLKRGEVWRERLTLNGAKGLAAQPITIGAYGASDARPQFNEGRVITGWQSAGNGIYKAAVTGDVTQVFADGRRLDNARSPNSGYYYIAADTPAANPPARYFTGPDLGRTREEVVGAEIHMRANRWIMDSALVADLTGTTVTIDRGHSRNFQRNGGFILANKLWMLDAPGEWFHDAASGTLYVRLSTDDDPAGHLVEAAGGATVALQITNSAFLQISNLEIRYPAMSGVALNGSTDIRLNNLSVFGAGERGVDIGNMPAGSGVVEVANSLVQDAGILGILVSNSADQRRDVRIRGNRILDTMSRFPSVRGHAGSVFYIGMGLCLLGNGIDARENFVSRTGYSGVVIHGASAVVENNIIEKTNLLLDDGGGIFMNGTGHVVRSNIVRDALGSNEGLPAFFTGGDTAAQGIYADIYSGSITIEDNTVINADWGVQIHDSHDNGVRRNNIMSTRLSALRISEDSTVNIPGYVRGNAIEDNVFYTAGARPCFSLAGYLGHTDFGVYNRNLLAHPNSETSIRLETTTGGIWSSRDFTAEEWNNAGYGTGSKGIPPTLVTSLSAVELVQNGAFESGAAGWSKWTPSGGAITIQAQQNECLAGGCLQTDIASSANGSLTISPNFAVEKDKSYVARFAARAISPVPLQLNAIVRRGGPTYETLGLNGLVSAPDSWKQYSFVFMSPATIPNARWDFQSMAGQFTYRLDEVSVREATVTHPDPPALLLNDTTASRSFDLGDRAYCDKDDVRVPRLVTVAPWRSMAVVDCSGAAGLNVTASATSPSQIDLSWTGLPGNTGVTAYRVYRNGGQAGATAGVTYIDAGLTPATQYFYVVEAIDIVGRVIGRSAPVSATTPSGLSYALSMQASPSGGGSIIASPASPDGNYADGAVVQLTATPAERYRFVDWSGDLSGTANPQSVTMTGPRNVTANFAVAASAIAIATNPPGLDIAVDGVTYRASQLFSWAVGSSHTVAAPSPQEASGTRHVFAGWSDDGAQSHTITVPGDNTTFTASFGAQYLLTRQVSPSTGGTISAVPTSPDGYYPSGASILLDAKTNAGYVFSGWSGGLTGAANPQTVVMSAPRTVSAAFTPGATTLTGGIVAKSGAASARLWAIRVDNTGPGAADAARIGGMNIRQTYGTSCTPIVTSPSAFPLALGNIAPGASATASITTNFSGCGPTARFRIEVPLSANGGAATGSIVRNNQYR